MSIIPYLADTGVLHFSHVSPQLVTHFPHDQFRSPISASLWAQDLRQDEGAVIRVRLPPYIDENLFSEYISQVLVPYISNLRENPEFANERAVLLMDSASTHVSERVLQLLGRNKIMAIVFPTHTTNNFQALNLVFFDVLKKIKKTATGEFDERSVREQITNFLQAYEQTAISMTIRASF
jgi:hypothetical protein